MSDYVPGQPMRTDLLRVITELATMMEQVPDKDRPFVMRTLWELVFGGKAT